MCNKNETISYCWKCGKALPDYFEYCIYCGSKVIKPEADMDTLKEIEGLKKRLAELMDDTPVTTSTETEAPAEEPEEKTGVALMDEYLSYMKSHAIKHKQTREPDLRFFYNQQFYAICDLLNNMLKDCDPKIWGEYYVRCEHLCALMDTPYVINGNKDFYQINEAVKYYEEQLDILLDAYETAVTTDNNLETIYRQKGRIEFCLSDFKSRPDLADRVRPFEERLNHIYELINKEESPETEDTQDDEETIPMATYEQL